MKLKSARLLNERPGWLGLSVWDLGLIGYVLIIFHSILEPWGLELLSFVVAAGAFIFLLKVRLKHRPKTIRDQIRNALTSKKIR